MCKQATKQFCDLAANTVTILQLKETGTEGMDTTCLWSQHSEIVKREFERRWTNFNPEFLLWKYTCMIETFKYFWWICLNLSPWSIIIIITNNPISLASISLLAKPKFGISSIICLLRTWAAVHEHSWGKSLNRHSDFTLNIWL